MSATNDLWSFCSLCHCNRCNDFRDLNNMSIDFIEICPCWLCENIRMRNNMPPLRNSSQAFLYNQTRNLVFFPPENDRNCITEFNNEYEMQTLNMTPDQVRHNNVQVMVPLINNHMITSQPAFRTHTPQDQPNYASQQPPNNRNDQNFQATVSHILFQPTELNGNQDSNHLASPLRNIDQPQLTPVQANIQINNNLQRQPSTVSQTSNLSDRSLQELKNCSCQVCVVLKNHLNVNDEPQNENYELVNSYCDTTEMIPVPSSSNRLKSTSHNKELDTLGIKDNDLFSLENNRYQVLERTPNEQSDNISDTRRHKRKKHSEDVRSLYERIGDGFKELQRSLPQTHFRKNMTKEVLLKTAASLLKNQEYRESFFLNEINRLNEELNHLNKELNHAERLKLKKNTPKIHHSLIVKQENITKENIARVNKEFILDYVKAIKEFEEERKSFNQQIKRKIEKKEDKIKELNCENKSLHNKIIDQNENILNKDNQINTLEEKMSNLRVQYDECIESNLILSYKLEAEHTQNDKNHIELEKLRKENKFQKDYINTKESDITKLVDETFELDKRNKELTLFIEGFYNNEEGEEDDDVDENERQWRQNQMVYQKAEEMHIDDDF
ncbi:42840_t:CDS:10 [Gigaspora margarita]|uniref:42840_t:CDS:1 n=1 Tax=Gigaspora margarita TaxID=4874 RepID=A0ABM8W1F7_GIGMA|nr:42840_t:CDS:10 [Gigaspora margarita]